VRETNKKAECAVLTKSIPAGAIRKGVS